MPLYKETLHTNTPTAFTQGSSYTEDFAQGSFYNRNFLQQKLLFREACKQSSFIHRRFYTHKKHGAAFTHSSFYTQTEVLFSHTHTHARTYKPLHEGTLLRLRTDTSTHRGFCTEKLLNREKPLHRGFYTQRLLHREAFPQSSSYTLESYRSLWRSAIISCKRLRLALESFGRSTIILRKRVALQLKNRNFAQTGCAWRFKFVTSFLIFASDAKKSQFAVFTVWPSCHASELHLNFENMNHLRCDPHFVRQGSAGPHQTWFCHTFGRPTRTIPAEGHLP